MYVLGEEKAGLMRPLDGARFKPPGMEVNNPPLGNPGESVGSCVPLLVHRGVEYVNDDGGCAVPINGRKAKSSAVNLIFRNKL